MVPVANDPLPDVKVTKKRGTKSAALNDEKKVEAAAAAKPAQRGRKNKTPPVEEEAEEVVVIAEGGAAEGEITRPRKRVAKVSRAPSTLYLSDQVSAEERRRAWSDLATSGHDRV